MHILNILVGNKLFVFVVFSHKFTYKSSNCFFLASNSSWVRIPSSSKDFNFLNSSSISFVDIGWLFLEAFLWYSSIFSWIKFFNCSTSLFLLGLKGIAVFRPYAEKAKVGSKPPYPPLCWEPAIVLSSNLPPRKRVAFLNETEAIAQ